MALALTALSWPVAAIVRRRYGAALTLDPRALRAFRLSKIGAILILAALGMWAMTIARMLKDINNLSAKFDLTIRFAQLFGMLAIVGGLAAMLWNLRMVWTGQRHCPAKIWSIVLTLAALVVLWIAWTFNLFSFGVNY